ncbi:MAG: ABC transporter permease, partial [Prevotellaceae bacterium]|nr:ABC transporter permease [Prevotellaceae bacterium]
MLKYLIEKEFKQFVRNEFLPRLVIIFPCIVMFILPWAANLEIKNIDVAVVDNDHSKYSTQLVNTVLASRYFTLKNASSTYAQAMEIIKKGDVDIILEIPYGFESDFVRENVSKLLISVNTVNGTKGLIGCSYLSMVIKDFAEKLLDEKGVLLTQSTTMNIPVIEVATKTLFNPHMEYKIFMVPALMVMLLTLISGFFPAVNIVTEKEKGTIEQLNVSPVRKIVFIFAKLIPYWIIGLVVLTVCFAIAYLMYGLIPAGSFLTLYLISLIYIFAVSGLGL